MSNKPSTPKGMRDFLPHEVIRRNYIMDVMKTQFERFGFLPIETPSMERRDLLLGKYGDEGDRLVFKVLNSGEKVKKADIHALTNGELSRFSNSISEKALRYDLTVPLARFVVQHQNELSFPFKRYQMQPVWRADRPQHGRFQEFFQCDADSIGSDSLFLELEFIHMIDAIFSDLQLMGCTLRVNHRKVLEAISNKAQTGKDTTTFLTILDKLDKMGWDEVQQQLAAAGFAIEIIDLIKETLLHKSNIDQLDALQPLLEVHNFEKNPFEDLNFLFANMGQLSSLNVVFDWTLARGLDYYTGTIFEISAPEAVSLGSIGAGGRYDDLTGVFGMKNMSGIGVSFGLDRIALVLSELDLFPADIHTSIDIFIIHFNKEMITALLPYVHQLRRNGKRVFVYPSAARLKKQLSLANQLNIPYALFMGEDEWKEKKCTIKNLHSGDQSEVLLEKIVDRSF